MSQLYVSSPVRSSGPRLVAAASPPVPGAARPTCALRYRGIALPPAGRKRLQFPCSPSHKTLQNGARGTATPAALYTSREETSAEAKARREDEEHGATQLILLLTLSVVLLTLPWVVDHPVTLLVPVALFILPITSDALRSLLSEGFALIAGGVRWFWRHRKTSQAYATVQPSSAAAPQRAPQPQPVAPHAPVQNTHTQKAWQSRGASAYTSQQRESWQSSALSGRYPVAGQSTDSPTRATGVQAGIMTGNGACRDGALNKHDWQPVLQRPRSVVQPTVMCPQSVAVPPELTTPDLDFDSDGEAAVQDCTHGHASYDGSYGQGPHPSGQGQAAQTQSMQQHNTQYSTAPRAPSNMRPTEQAECTVYNWDQLEECTQRRGHRPLSGLLNNVQ